MSSKYLENEMVPRRKREESLYPSSRGTGLSASADLNPRIGSIPRPTPSSGDMGSPSADPDVSFMMRYGHPAPDRGLPSPTQIDLMDDEDDEERMREFIRSSLREDDEDSEDEEDVENESSGAGGVSGYTLPLGMSNKKSKRMRSWMSMRHP